MERGPLLLAPEQFVKYRVCKGTDRHLPIGSVWNLPMVIYPLLQTFPQNLQVTTLQNRSSLIRDRKINSNAQRNQLTSRVKWVCR